MDMKSEDLFTYYIPLMDNAWITINHFKLTIPQAESYFSSQFEEIKTWWIES